LAFNKVIIIAGGSISKGIDIELLNDAYIMAVNGGVENALKLGITPSLLLGDLDSADPDNLEWAKEKGIKIKRFPQDKDYSDLELALDEAVEMNPREIFILGATGGRTDHLLFNIFILLKYSETNIRIVMLNIEEKIFLAKSGGKIFEPVNATVSLIPLTSEVNGITTSGLKYSLEEETLYMGSSRGLSNVIIESPFTIYFTAGKLLVIINQAGDP